MHVEFWFDFSCPYAYLASKRIEQVCQGRATLSFHPMLLGGVFRSIGAGDGPMATLSPSKALHNARDMTRYAERFDVPFHMPPSHPMRTVLALRTLLGLPERDWPTAMHALYAAYWQTGSDITQAEVIQKALVTAGLAVDDVTAALATAESDERKLELRTRTDEAVAHGVFGAPAMRVITDHGDEPVLLWGQDRLTWLSAVLDGWRPDHEVPPGGPAITAVEPASPGRVVDFYFDVASPFAYFGATQIVDLCQRAGATLRLRPILLGALFRNLGTVDVPLFAFPPSKRRYVGLEFSRWARYWDIPARFPSKFPQRTVTAQRMIAIAGEHAEPLMQAMFAAMWAENRDLEDPAVLAELAAAVGAPADLLARASSSEAKALLRQYTDEAQAAGVFGVPSMVVHDPGGPLLYWGQDRLELLADALAGKRPEAE